ncbi:30S ribosomal protein S8 [Desulfonatronovibrio hydrogenovorans]|uniref:30S ribosomal protein S8 n=1 Tax=Desulfonatronovibrio hydrogenovorans TaxID=53245 RepID=UPI00048B1E2F|nr:30S ribosomal protein S8 [Desulfonatronovibrio hydrogenovorans]
MPVVDPIADMLTRIRNGQMALHQSVNIPFSKAKISIVEIMANEGFISDYKIEDSSIVVDLKYKGSRPVVKGMKRISKPGRKVYVPVSEIPAVRNGLGICILSTSKGVLEGGEAHKQNVGGELICEIW